MRIGCIRTPYLTSMKSAKTKVALFVALCFITLVTWNLNENRQFVKTGVRTVGMVTHLTTPWHIKSKKSRTFISFQAENNNRIYKSLETGLSPFPYLVGDSIAIIYSRKNPRNILLGDPFYLYGLLSMVLVVLGILVLGLVINLVKNSSNA